MIVVIRVQILFSISSHIIPFIKLIIIPLYPIIELKSRTLVGLDSILKHQLLAHSEHGAARDTKTDIKL